MLSNSRKEFPLPSIVGSMFGGNSKDNCITYFSSGRSGCTSPVCWGASACRSPVREKCDLRCHQSTLAAWHSGPESKDLVILWYFSPGGGGGTRFNSNKATVSKSPRFSGNTPKICLVFRGNPRTGGFPLGFPLKNTTKNGWYQLGGSPPSP